MARERKSNIELLRIIIILGVIILHYNHRNMGGALQYVVKGSGNYYLLLLLEAISICAVDVFVLISGYFLCSSKDRNLWKPIKLIVQVMLFSVAPYLVKVCLRRGQLYAKEIILLLVPANYFVILYCALYLISPFINVLLDNLTGKQTAKLVKWLFILFCVYPTLVDFFGQITEFEWYGLSTIGASGSQDGYTIVNFVIMYILGAYIRKGYAAVTQWRIKNLIVAYLITLGIICLWTAADILIDSSTGNTAWSYCNPIVVLNAVIVFVLFLRVPVKKNRVINKLADGVFSVFLLHSIFLPHIRIAQFVNRSVFILLGHIIISTCGIYMLCYFVHRIYSAIMDPLFKWLSVCVKLPSI